MRALKSILALLFILPFFAGNTAIAKMSQSQGVVATIKIPAPVISKKIVRLNVPHIRQKRDLCVPTSSAMILKYFGERHNPTALKKLAENYKPKSKRNKTFTYWRDMRHALKKVGKIGLLKIIGIHCRDSVQG